MGRGTGGRSGTRGPRKGRRLRAWIAPRASRLHGAVRRWRRLFHAPGKIFLFSWAPAAEAGNCLPCRRPEQGGASRPCPWRGLCRVPPAFMELFGAGGVFFTLRGKFFFFPGLQPLRQGTACRVGGRSRGGSIAAVPVAWFVPRVSRLHGAVRCCQRLFHAPGEIFANGEREGGTSVERGTAWTHAMM